MDMLSAKYFNGMQQL